MSKSVEARVKTQLGKTRNSEVLASFVAFCQQHPDQRFWQALRNWCEMPFVLVSHLAPHDLLGTTSQAAIYDTFYWEGVGTDAEEKRLGKDWKPLYWSEQPHEKAFGTHIKEAVEIVRSWRGNEQS